MRAFRALKFYVESLGEILSQEVGGTRLQGFIILQQCFNTVGFHGTGKALRLRFKPGFNRHGHIIFGEGSVHFQHLFGLLNGLFFCGMSRVAFLP